MSVMIEYIVMGSCHRSQLLGLTINFQGESDLLSCLKLYNYNNNYICVNLLGAKTMLWPKIANLTLNS